MKILIAPDKFKGSLTAPEVCESISKGLLKSDNSPELVKHPLADGGDGSIDILAEAMDMEKISLKVPNPLGNPVDAYYYLSEKKAFIELAVASGLVLCTPENQNPINTSTLGTGLLILDALNKGAKEIFLFVGGSATHDGGMGIAQALGFRFLDAHGHELQPIGRHLAKVNQIDTGYQNLNPFSITVLHDVKNPLLGIHGAAATFAEQKGATPDDVATLEAGMTHFVQLVENLSGQKLKEQPGMGAAGGVGVCLVGLLNAQMKNGVDVLMKLTGFPESLEAFDWVITGEGQLDEQSLKGKVVGTVATLAQKAGVPCVALVGQNKISERKLANSGIWKVLSLVNYASNTQEAIEQGAKLLEQVAFELQKEW